MVSFTRSRLDACHSYCLFFPDTIVQTCAAELVLEISELIFKSGSLGGSQGVTEQPQKFFGGKKSGRNVGPL